MTDIEEKLARFRKTKPTETVTSDSNTSTVSETVRNIFSKSSPSSSSNESGSTEKRQKEATKTDEIEEPEEIEVPLRIRVIKIVLSFLLWAILFAIFIKLEFGVVYFVISLLVVIYLNTGRRKPGTKSAYSVFNPNVERIQGQLTAEQLQQNLLRPF